MESEGLLFANSEQVHIMHIATIRKFRTVQVYLVVPHTNHMTNDPITPPPELVQQIRDNAVYGGDDQQSYGLRLITAAYRAGADQELEACVEWLQDPDLNVDTDKLRAARRPKPPSLKQQACDALDTYIYGEPDPRDTETHWLKERTYNTIRKALETLND